MSQTRLLLGPFNRVEGDLEVTLDVADGAVVAARVNAPLFRGFERILEHRPPTDALVVAPRICGICSVSQSIAAAAALAGAMGLTPARNGRLATNLVHAAENLADHLTHFYLFFMPDFARADYAAKDWHGHAAARFKAVDGAAAREFPAVRARWMRVVGILAGKWPHSLALQPGGTTKSVDAGELARLRAAVAEMRGFLERTVFSAPLEAVLDLRTADDLAAWRDGGRADDGDFRFFLRLAEDLRLSGLGGWDATLMSFGAYPGEDGEGPTFRAGVRSGGAVAPFDPSAIAEDPTHAWMAGTPVHPARGLTEPDADKPEAYTWCKAPRLDGRPVEVGALARQAVDGHPLIVALLDEGGANVFSRVVARLIEAARIIPAMEGWLNALRPQEAFCAHGVMPAEATSAGLTEAARGGLGHWLTIAGGRIARYQIIAPTTWNFAPRDAKGTPGPLEQALIGAPTGGGAGTPVAVQHVVRSFDPCMVCTVH